MTNEHVQAFITQAEQAVEDLRGQAADARKRGLEQLVQLGQRAQAQLDQGDAGEVMAEP